MSLFFKSKETCQISNMHSYFKKLEKVIQNKYSKQVELLIKVGAEINVIQDIIRIEEIKPKKVNSTNKQKTTSKTTSTNQSSKKNQNVLL